MLDGGKLKDAHGLWRLEDSRATDGSFQMGVKFYTSNYILIILALG